MTKQTDDIVLYNTEDEVKIQTNQPKVTTFELVPPTHEMEVPLREFNFKNSPVDPNELASTLVETCKKHNGLGLSANQCGQPYRVFVMGTGDDYIACFNPKLVSFEGEAHMPEGCLTFPLLELRISRPKKINVEYQDWNGKKHTATFDGITARVFLHELDHMNGILYTSRAKPLALQSGVKKLEKIKRKYFNPKTMKRLHNGKKINNS